ncbi:MAG: TetR family transcriptional regulator C-terminal domain-containing protein [Thermonemataceae bacterium]|nr:TetR family transcriptional regulator C-terminal domain-containing protein [Thermonemataceae bacterium]
MAKKDKNKIVENNPNWQEIYIAFVLEKNRKPSSIYELTQFAEQEESEFYQAFSSLESIESAFWLEQFQNTRSQIENDTQYQGFSVREKLLAFAFTWLENLEQNRAFIMVLKNNVKMKSLKTLEDFKNSFEDFAQELINEALETEEVLNRTFLNKAYPKAMWGTIMYILGFWLKDTSPNFEQTDAAVEKSVNFFFDLTGRTFLDSFADFAKFSFQSFKK